MDSEETASGAQGSGPPRRSPRFVAQGQQKLKVYKSNKDRKKRLKLPSPSPADVQSEAHGGDEDPDFHPDIEAEGGGDADVGADDGGLNVASKKRLRKQPPAIRCSPAKFLELLGAAPVDVIDQVKAKGFGGLLGFKPICLDRKLLTWIMPRLNPESMKLEIGGGKEIPVTEHAIWCIFQIPKFGGDPPSMSDVDARTKRNELGEQICPSSYKRFGIRISDIVDGLKTNRLTGDLAVRAFFMGVFQCLLFSNTDSHIRLEDVIYTENLDDIGNINWCKVVVDNICRAARLYRKDFPAKGAQTPINGCGIFLIMLYVDHLLHGLDVDPFTLTRCAILESKTIDAISALDRRGDVPADVVEYGNLRLRSSTATCYTPPPFAHAVASTHPLPVAPPCPPPPPPQPTLDAVGISVDVLATHLAPPLHVPIELQPPSLQQYPSLLDAFGQSIVDVVGRSRKSEAHKILKAFDDSSARAQCVVYKQAWFVKAMNKHGSSWRTNKHDRLQHHHRRHAPAPKAPSSPSSSRRLTATSASAPL